MSHQIKITHVLLKTVRSNAAYARYNIRKHLFLNQLSAVTESIFKIRSSAKIFHLVLSNKIFKNSILEILQGECSTCDLKIFIYTFRKNLRNVANLGCWYVDTVITLIA